MVEIKKTLVVVGDKDCGQAEFYSHFVYERVNMEDPFSDNPYIQFRRATKGGRTQWKYYVYLINPEKGITSGIKDLIKKADAAIILRDVVKLRDNGEKKWRGNLEAWATLVSNINDKIQLFFIATSDTDEIDKTAGKILNELMKKFLPRARIGFVDVNNEKSCNDIFRQI